MYRARNMKNNEDLELRLGRSPKGLNPRGNTFPMGYPELINIEDDDDYEDDHDDDEVQVFSHRPAETIRFFARFGSWTPVISDEDLELRLGPRDRSGCRSEEPLSLFCDKVCEKQLGQASSSQLGMGMNQLKLRCSICMDTMKEETSTVCGHVFCKPWNNIIIDCLDWCYSSIVLVDEQMAIRTMYIIVSGFWWSGLWTMSD